jgi:putative nucleotidyltransferase with HDIG domain
MPKSLLPKLRRRRKRSDSAVPLKRHWLRVDPARLLLTVGTTALLSILMSIHFLPDRVSLNVGDRSPIEVKAARSVSYVNTDATIRRQEDAARSVPNSYDPDRTALAQASRYVADVFDTVRRVRTAPPPAKSGQKLQMLTAELGSVFTQEQLKNLLSLPVGALDRLEQTSSRLVEATMAQPLRSDTGDLPTARRSFDADVRREIGAASEAEIARALGAKALRANQFVNVRRTRALRDARIREVKPVTGDIRAGEVILRQGEVFTQLHQDKATALGLISPSLDLVTAASIAGLSIGMVLIVALFVRRTRPEIYADTRRLALLATIVLFSVLGLKLFGQVLGIPLSLLQFGYLGMMMVVAAGMMISVMLSTSTAILVTALLSVLTGLIMNHELRFTVMTLISGFVGIYSVTDIRHRNDLLKATAMVAAANLILVWVLGGLVGDSLSEVMSGSAWAMVAAAIGVGAFWFGVTILEKPFGVLTHAWLLELSASEHPLLRELCMTAPGTYAHSVMVGNLAEAGAEAIGANGFFCRVASYYHDIGKMRRPDFFVENQHAENVHNRLNPSLSALIIASHVRDGIDLADQHRLPPQFKAIIAEHHGTSLIQYFYNQAVAGSGHPERHDPVLEQHFRYEGPKPQTPESGIIMLADTVEAAVRCLERPTAQRIQNRIDELIQLKLADGQLDECDLTFKDIKKIQAAFGRIMTGMLHGRIEYKVPKTTPGLAAQGLSIALPEPLASELVSEEAPCAAVHANHYPQLPNDPAKHKSSTGRGRTGAPH